MKLALVVHEGRAEAVGIATAFADAAAERGLTVVEDATSAGLDAVIAIGGDGTVLEALRRAHQADVPVLGINAGHVGFLAAVDPARTGEALDLLAAGEYGISERMTVAAEWDGNVTTGINDVVFEKVVSQHAVRLALRVDGRHFTTYRADGLVIATPTGSTAYAFSAGGPMVDPELEAMLATPVAAHNIFAPTVLFGAGAQLEVRSHSDRQMRLNVDGREAAVLDPEAVVRVRRGDRNARFIVPWPRPFTDVLREKFRLAEEEGRA